MKTWCRTCRCDIGTQSWVQRFNVQAAHLGTRMLKRKWPGRGPMPNGTEIWLFEGEKVDEMAWNFLWDNPSHQVNHFHMVASPRSSGAMHRHAKTLCPGWEVATFHEAAKMSDRVTLWHVDKTHRWHLGSLDLVCLLCNVFQLAPGYVCVSVSVTQSKMTQSNSTRSSDDRSGGAMFEEDVETAKSEFRLGMLCILHRGLIYS